MEQSKSSSGSDWCNEMLSHAVLANKHQKRSNNKLALATKLEKPSSVPGLTMVKPTKKLFADAVDYRNYRVTEK